MFTRQLQKISDKILSSVTLVRGFYLKLTLGVEDWQKPTGPAEV